MKGLLIGLDEVLISTKSGNRYPIHSKDWELNEYVLEAIKYYVNKDYIPIIITNQDSVRDGLLHEKVFIKKLIDICNHIESVLGLEVNTMNFIYCVEDGNRRIPNNGMVIEAVQDYEISLKNTIMIGGNELDANFSNYCFIGEFINVNDLPKYEFDINRV